MREAIQNTGAVVMGWNAFAVAKDPDLYADNYEFQVPIFFLTHTVPQRKPKETDQLTFTFITDGIERAIEQAKAAAGPKGTTIIGGTSTTSSRSKLALLTSCTLTLCRYSCTVVFGYLKQLGLNRFAWKE